MSNVCQIFNAVTLDTLDNMVYTLDILAANIGHQALGGNHGKSVDGENESRTTRESLGLFCSPLRIHLYQVRWTDGERLLHGFTEQHWRVGVCRETLCAVW